MKVESQKLASGDLEVKLTFDAHDQRCLQHDLIDIVEWYSSGPAVEKIANCEKRMIKDNKELLLQSSEFQFKSMGEVNAILANERALCEAICKMQSYKNRAQREKG